MLVYESSNIDESNDTASDDGQGAVLDRAKERSIKKLVRSKSLHDRRFINMTRVQIARRYGVKIGFKGLDRAEFEHRREIGYLNRDRSNNSTML